MTKQKVGEVAVVADPVAAGVAAGVAVVVGVAHHLDSDRLVRPEHPAHLRLLFDFDLYLVVDHQVRQVLDRLALGLKIQIILIVYFLYSRNLYLYDFFF
jgi:hypothetical protein